MKIWSVNFQLISRNILKKWFLTCLNQQNNYYWLMIAHIMSGCRVISALIMTFCVINGKKKKGELLNQIELCRVSKSLDCRIFAQQLVSLQITTWLCVQVKEVGVSPEDGKSFWTKKNKNGRDIFTATSSNCNIISLSYCRLASHAHTHTVL